MEDTKVIIVGVGNHEEALRLHKAVSRLSKAAKVVAVDFATSQSRIIKAFEQVKPPIDLNKGMEAFEIPVNYEKPRSKYHK